MGVGGRRKQQAVVFVEDYLCSASVFKQGKYVVDLAIPGAVFDEVVFINNRIPLVLLVSRNESNCSM